MASAFCPTCGYETCLHDSDGTPIIENHDLWCRAARVHGDEVWWTEERREWKRLLSKIAEEWPGG